MPQTAVALTSLTVNDTRCTVPRSMSTSSSEESLAAGKNVVQRILEVRRTLGELLADLLHILLVALLDLLLEELAQSAVTHSGFTFVRMVRDHVRHESTCKPSSLDVRVACEERIDRLALSACCWRRGWGCGRAGRGRCRRCHSLCAHSGRQRMRG